LGDIPALAAKTGDAHGAVLWGISRSRGIATDLRVQPAVQVGVDWNVPIRVAGATVLPGDVVVAGEEAVLCFPASIAARVIEESARLEEQENYERELVRENKHEFREVYPLNKELRQKFEEQRRK
jgi:hypothetical protein